MRIRNTIVMIRIMIIIKEKEKHEKWQLKRLYKIEKYFSPDF